MISAQARASACPPKRRIKSSGRRALRGDELADRDIPHAVIAPGNEPPMVVDLAEMIAAMHGKLDEPVARLERPIADALWVLGIERNVARRCERARDHVQRGVDLAHDLGARHIAAIELGVAVADVTRGTERRADEMLEVAREMQR